MKALEGSVLNFTIDNIRRSMWYDVIVRYEPVQPGVWEDVQIILERDSLPDPNGPCADWRPEYDRLWVQLPLRSRSALAQPSICLEAGKRYNLLLQFRKFNSHVDTPLASILVDSVIYFISIVIKKCLIISNHNLDCIIYICMIFADYSEAEDRRDTLLQDSGTG